MVAAMGLTKMAMYREFDEMIGSACFEEIAFQIQVRTCLRSCYLDLSFMPIADFICFMCSRMNIIPFATDICRSCTNTFCDGDMRPGGLYCLSWWPMMWSRMSKISSVGCGSCGSFAC